jgi:hypothetical protein
MLRPIKHLDPHPGEAVAAPRARVLSATVIRRVDRWYVCLNIEAPAFHPGRRHQHRSQDEGRRFVGIDRGLTVFAVVADSDGVEVCRFAALGRWLAASAGYIGAPAGSDALSGDPRTGQRPPACWPESTIVLP